MTYGPTPVPEPGVGDSFIKAPGEYCTTVCIFYDTSMSTVFPGHIQHEGFSHVFSVVSFFSRNPGVNFPAGATRSQQVETTVRLAGVK